MLNAVLIFLLFCFPVQDETHLSAVPIDAQVVITIHDLGELKDVLDESAWGRFLRDPEMKEFFERLDKEHDIKIDLDFELDEEMEGVSPRKFLESVAGSITVFARLGGFKRGTGCVIVEPGDKREAFDEYMAALEELLYESEEYTDSTDTYGDVELLIGEPSDESSRDANLVLADSGDVAVFIVDRDLDKGIELMQSVLDALSGEQEMESILESEAYQNAREQAGGPGDVEAYVDVGCLIDYWFADMKAARGDENGEHESEAEQIRSMLGLGDLSTVYFRADAGEGETTDLSLHIGIAGEGLIRNIVDGLMGDVPLNMLKSIPADAVAAGAGQVDISSIYNRIMDEFEAQNPEEYNQFRGIYRDTVVKTIGIDPEKEIIGQLDGRFASYSMEVPEEEFAVMRAFNIGAVQGDSGMNYGGTFIIGLNDAKAFQASFEKMLRATGVYVSMKKDDFQGQRIYSIQIPMINVRLYWVFTEEFMGLSLFPTAIRSFVRVLSHDELPAVTDKKEFMSLVKTHGDATDMFVGDTSLQIKGFFGGLVGAILGFDRAMSSGRVEPGGSMDDGSLPIPSEELIKRYFKGVSGLFMEIDDQGIRVDFVTR